MTQIVLVGLQKLLGSMGMLRHATSFIFRASGWGLIQRLYGESLVPLRLHLHLCLRLGTGQLVSVSCHGKLWIWYLWLNSVGGNARSKSRAPRRKLQRIRLIGLHLMVTD
jgi:hypothetical protein